MLDVRSEYISLSELLCCWLRVILPCRNFGTFSLSGYCNLDNFTNFGSTNVVSSALYAWAQVRISGYFEQRGAAASTVIGASVDYAEYLTVNGGGFYGGTTSLLYFVCASYFNEGDPLC